jgi:hypothetical protein
MAIMTPVETGLRIEPINSWISTMYGSMSGLAKVY